MSRRHAAEKREILPDPIHGDLVVSKFMNNLMLDGKKSAAERIVYQAFEQIERKVGRNPVDIFHEALTNTKPALEVRSRRVGGASDFRHRVGAPTISHPDASAEGGGQDASPRSPLECQRHGERR